MIDLIIIGIIALCTFIGYKRGLIKVALKLCSLIIAIVISLILYRPVTNFVIDNTQIDDNIQNAIIEKVLPEGASEDTAIANYNSLPKMIMEGTENTVKSIANTITLKIIEIVVLIAIFMIAKIILRFVLILTNFIEKIPIIKQFNKAGGLIYGILQGFIWVFTILAFISLVSPFMDSNYIEMINNSLIGSILYKNNILLNIIS